MTKKAKNAFIKTLNWCDFDKITSGQVGTTNQGRFAALMNDVAYNLRVSVDHLKDNDAHEKQGIIFDEAWKRLASTGMVRAVAA